MTTLAKLLDLLRSKLSTATPAVRRAARSDFETLEDRAVPAVLSEVNVNPPSTDDPFEFVEIRGAANEALTNLYLVAIEGDSGAAAGAADFVVNLSALSLGSNGLLIIKATSGGHVPPGATTVVGDAQLNDGTAPLENGTISFLLIQSAAAIIEGTDYDVGDDGVLEALPGGATIVDAVGWTDGGSGDRVYGGVVLTQSSGTPDAAVRFAGDDTPINLASWFNGDLSGANSTLAFSATQVSANFPSGAQLTPGAPNGGVVTANTQPVLNAGSSPTLADVVRNSPAPVGMVGSLVSRLVDLTPPAGDGVDNVTDPDAGAVTGAAITATTGAGQWWFSTNNGTNWSMFPSVSATAGLQLRPTDRVYYQPPVSFTGTLASALTFKAWDQTGATAGMQGTTADTTVGTPFSAATDTASITVAVVNNAPVLNPVPNPVLPSIAEDAPGPVGMVGALVLELVDLTSPPAGFNNVTDADGDAPGLAVTATTGGGIWSYSLNNGTTWIPFPAVSNAMGLLLRPGDRVYYMPAANENGVFTFTFKAWDQTAGTAGTTVDTTAGSAFSTAFDTAAITVTEVNDDPNAVNDGAGPVFPSIDTLETFPILISTLLGNDNAGPANESGQTLRLSLAGVTVNGTVVRDGAFVRFTPAGPGPASFQYIVTDDGTDNGIISPRFSALATVFLNVAAENDAPILDTAGVYTLPAVKINDTAPSGISVADLLAQGPGGDPISDPDQTTAQGIAITAVDDTNGTWQYSINGGTTWLAVGPLGVDQARLLNSAPNTRLRFLPDGSGAPTFNRMITFRAWDAPVGLNGGLGNVAIVGGITAF
ncbi:MAG: hypothetical protein ACRDD1_02805, partial [Planctomycetia bacterium]